MDNENVELRSRILVFEEDFLMFSGMDCTVQDYCRSERKLGDVCLVLDVGCFEMPEFIHDFPRLHAGGTNILRQTIYLNHHCIVLRETDLYLSQSNKPWQTISTATWTRKWSSQPPKRSQSLQPSRTCILKKIFYEEFTLMATNRPRQSNHEPLYRYARVAIQLRRLSRVLARQQHSQSASYRFLRLQSGKLKVRHG